MERLWDVEMGTGSRIRLPEQRRWWLSRLLNGVEETLGCFRSAEWRRAFLCCALHEACVAFLLNGGDVGYQEPCKN